MKKYYSFILLFFIICFAAACDDTGTEDGDGNVVADRILAVAEFEGNNETIKVGGIEGAVPPGSEVSVTNLNTNETKTTVGLPDGSFDPEFQASTDDIFRVEVTDNGELVDSTDLSVITLESLVNTNISQLGSVPTTIKILGNRAYVLNGFSDNIQIFDIDQNPPVEIGTITLPPGSNPVDMDFINENSALVANNISQTAAIVDLNTAQCETLFTRQEGVSFDPCNEVINLGTGRFEEPSKVLVIDSTAYITNNDLNSNFVPNGNGFITVINLNTNSSFTIPSGGSNPSNMAIVGDEIFIVNAGNINFNPISSSFTCDQFFQPSIDVLNVNSNTIIENIPISLSESNPNVCAPGAIVVTPDERFAYIGLGLVGALLKFDIENKELVNDSENPIVITDLSGLNFTADLAIDDNGIGYTSLFNSDQIAVFDTSNDEINPFPAIAPFPAGIRASDPDNNFFDGVQGLAVRPGTPGIDFSGPNLFFITGISQQLGTVNPGIILQ